MASVRPDSNNTNKNKRNLGQYLFDLIIKTLLCAVIISINFTLFVNAGSYNLFSSHMYGNMEALYIYAGIGVFSFLLMFIASLIRPLENIVLSIVVALFTMVTINQFAIFDNHSALLLLFDGVFSNDINMILYEYGFGLTIGLVFIISLIILSLFKRSFVFYLTVALCGLLGWLISEAYLNPVVNYYHEVAGLPNLKKENMGKNIIFLSFRDLTSVSNLRNMNNSAKKNDDLDKAFKNALGFYNFNGFTLYPNALVGDDDNAIDSLAKSFNSEKTGDDTLFAQEILRDGYFDFSVLHNDKMVLKSNSLYDLLRKEGYKINVFQTGELDTCYVNNVLSVSSCVEKINTPITLIGEEFTTLDKLMVLLVQWIDSTGLVSTINPVLRMLEQIIPGLPNEFKAKNVELGKVYSYNSIRIFDKLVETIDRLSGNQAYFAIIDLPSDNFVYDEFCEVNLVNDWMSSHNVSGSVLPKSEKISAYARQTSCLYGRLQKFLVELNNMGILEDSTIVIQGLNSPADFIVKGDNFFKQIQTKRGVTFAVKNFEGVDEGIDYSVCSVPEIITSIFFNKKPCESYKVLNTSENNRNKAKSVVEADMFDKKAIDQATTFFNEWFKLWKTENGLETDVLSEPKHEPKVVDKSEVMDNVIEDVPEVKMESISSVEDVVGEVLDGQADEAVEKDTNVEDTTKDNVEEPSKLEKIAKITFDEISAKVDEVVKQRDTSNTDNVIEKINNIAGGLSKNIDDTFDNIGKKVAEVVRDSEPGEVVKEPEVEDIVTRTKKAILEKEANRLSDIKEDLEEKINAKNGVVLEIETEGNLDIKTDNEIVEKAYSQSKELRDILEAPVAEGQNLSPEELKKAYHEKLKNAAKKADIKIEVVE